MGAMTQQNLTPATVELRVPGAVWHECFNPLATGVPEEHGWPAPTRINRGRGFTAVYRVQLGTALDMVAHAANWAEGLTYGVDPECARSARRVLRWATETQEKLSTTVPVPNHNTTKEVAMAIAVNPSTTDHPQEAKDLLKRAGLSEESELTKTQAKALETLVNEGTDKEGDALTKAIMKPKGNGGGGAAKAKSKYSAEVQALQAKAVAVCEEAGIKKPVVPNQTNNVRKAIGSKDIAEATGTPVAELETYALKGDKPTDAKPLREFVKRHKALREDANLGPRKVAVVVTAMGR